MSKQVRPARRVNAKTSRQRLTLRVSIKKEGEAVGDTAEQALATGDVGDFATTDVLAQTEVLGGLLAALALRSQMIVALIRTGREMDKIITSHKTCFNTAAKMVARARSITSKTKAARALREDYLEGAQTGLETQAAIVYPPIDWPDERDYLAGTNAI